MSKFKIILSYLVFISGWLFAIYFTLVKFNAILAGIGGLMIVASGTKFIIFLYHGEKESRPKIVFEK